MDFLKLKKLVYNCLGHFKTRQHIWHHCIERIQKGDIGLEFGVYRGTSINYFANARPDNQFHGFDSFNGLPERWNAGNPKGKFKVGDKSILRFSKNITIHDGMFADTLPTFRKAHKSKLGRVKFIHIDCDLGSSSTTVLSELESLILQNKPLMLFDEFYGYLGFEDNEFLSFLNFVNRTGANFEVIGRNIHREQCLIQIH